MAQLSKNQQSTVAVLSLSQLLACGALVWAATQKNWLVVAIYLAVIVGGAAYYSWLNMRAQTQESDKAERAALLQRIAALEEEVRRLSKRQ